MALHRDKTVRLGAAVVLSAVFVAGAAVGISINSDEARAPEKTSDTSDGIRRDRAEAPSDWIIDRLDLTLDQRAAVDSVVAHYGKHMNQLQKDYRPRYRAIVDSTDRSLRALLSSEQVVRYDSLTLVNERWRARNRANGRNR